MLGLACGLGFIILIPLLPLCPLNSLPGFSHSCLKLSEGKSGLTVPRVAQCLTLTFSSDSHELRKVLGLRQQRMELKQKLSTLAVWSGP